MYLLPPLHLYDTNREWSRTTDGSGVLNRSCRRAAKRAWRRAPKPRDCTPQAPACRTAGPDRGAWSPGRTTESRRVRRGRSWRPAGSTARGCCRPSRRRGAGRRTRRRARGSASCAGRDRAGPSVRAARNTVPDCCASPLLDRAASCTCTPCLRLDQSLPLAFSFLSSPGEKLKTD